jgi:hypothetical protein
MIHFRWPSDKSGLKKCGQDRMDRFGPSVRKPTNGRHFNRSVGIRAHVSGLETASNPNCSPRMRDERNHWIIPPPDCKNSPLPRYAPPGVRATNATFPMSRSRGAAGHSRTWCCLMGSDSGTLSNKPRNGVIGTARYCDASFPPDSLDRLQRLDVFSAAGAQLGNVLRRWI